MKEKGRWTYFALFMTLVLVLCAVLVDIAITLDYKQKIEKMTEDFWERFYIPEPFDINSMGKPLFINGTLTGFSFADTAPYTTGTFYLDGTFLSPEYNVTMDNIDHEMILKASSLINHNVSFICFFNEKE